MIPNSLIISCLWLNSLDIVIGIHNQDPLALYVQFSVDEHYYIYERDCVSISEYVKEELFEEKNYGRKDLHHLDEQILLGKICLTQKLRGL